MPPVQEQEYELTEYGFKRYNICGMRFEVTPNFAVKKAVGQGAYGLVCSGSNTDTGNKVAIKKIPKAFEDTIDCKRLLREIKILRHFRHDNVLGCVESTADAWPASAAQRLIGRGRPEPRYGRPSSGAERSLRSSSLAPRPEAACFARYRCSGCSISYRPRGTRRTGRTCTLCRSSWIPTCTTSYTASSR